MNPHLLNNRYRTIKTLGAGGFGQTFLAEDTYLPSARRCVIKQLKPLTTNPQMLQLAQERFPREAATLERLGEGTDQIPKLYAYFTEAGQFYLVQEYIEGQTLTDKVQQQGAIPEDTVRAILVSLLPVLDYIHGHRIIHRDIKPDNIIIRQRDGKPVLIDFGAVKESLGTVAAGNPSIMIGTPGYMPSEQAAGHPVYASDLYSLGVTAIFLLTGKTPEELPTNPQTGELQWRSHAVNVSQSLAAILDRVIQSHPRDRFSSAKEMLHALESAVSLSPGSNVSHVATVAIAPGSSYPANSNPHPVSPGYANPPAATPQKTPVVIATPNPLLSKGPLIIAGLAATFVVAILLLNKLLNSRTETVSKSQPNIEQSTRSPSVDRSPISESTSAPAIVESPSPDPVRSPIVRTSENDPASTPELVRSPVVRTSENDPASVPAPVRSPIVRTSENQPISTPEPVRPSIFRGESPVRVPENQPTSAPAPVVRENPQTSDRADSSNVPAFGVGTSRDTVEATLGKRTRDYKGVWGNTRAISYKLVPNQIDLGYLYDRNSRQIRQTEVSFAQSVELPVMLTTLDRLLPGGATEDIKQGLQQVQQRRRSSYRFTSGSLKGQIVRQDCDFIYISIWDADLHDFNVEDARGC